ncbi:lysylphosphatidylglycerol synthase domain-containing protein [Rhabdaerophilum calidifontis]|uniref:lysylphosphatidylglycerol synthase domain-containing protein n=1 Tax=Rhabdaerophilum calidifontis TaxID=2604328 RepID=UPI001FEB1D7F|nr:lysylphosphatidylglycerol synthase domain-containing protein [Rhabdaerophilum calidifontis]
MNDASETAPIAAGQRARRARLLRIAGTIASLALFALSLVVLYVVIGELEAAEVRAAFARASAGQVGLALAFTALSYLMLTGYDRIALKEVTTLAIPYRIAALASFTSYAVSFTMGFPLLTAATVRYWIYSSVGLGAKAIASLTLIAGITFWLGMGVVLGAVMILLPGAASAFTRLPLALNMLLGAAVLGAVGFYLLLVARGGGRSAIVQGWALRFPGLDVTLKQMALGAADVCAGAAVLYVLLPPAAEVPFATMLAAYVFACLLGIASHAPGGIGVFEATMLLALPGVPSEALLGALLVYRLCYYLLPFVLALILLGTREIMIRAGILQRQLAAPPGRGPDA